MGTMHWRTALAAGCLSVAMDAAAAPCAGFDDVDDASAFCSSVAWIKNRGVTVGCLGNAYCPNDAVSRLAMAAFMKRLADALFPLTCPTGSVLKWNGADWACALDAIGPGTVTSVASGPGLQGGPITGAGTLSIADGAVTAAMLAPGAVTASRLAAGTAAARPVYKEVEIDGDGTGRHSSIVVGVDGLPLIAYYAQVEGDLKVAHCESVDCTTATLATLESAGDTGQFPSAVVQADGRAAIAYLDTNSRRLKVAYCSDTACSSAAIGVADASNALHLSAAVNADGVLWIAFLSGRELALAACSSVPCSPSSTWTRARPRGLEVDEDAGVGLVIDDANRPLFSYYDTRGRAVRVMRCESATTCAAPVQLASDGGAAAEGIAMTLGREGNPVVSYVVREVNLGRTTVLVCADANCTTRTITQSAAAYDFPRPVGKTAVTVPSDGLPVALATAAPAGDCDRATQGRLAELIKCRGPGCASPAVHFYDLGINPSATINSTGYPVAAYGRCGARGSRLHVLHCATEPCLGHIRPR